MGDGRWRAYQRAMLLILPEHWPPEMSGLMSPAAAPNVPGLPVAGRC